MNKIAQQFQNDVVVRYQQKMAELVKRAEEKQQQQPPQDPQSYPTNIREMDPRRAAEAVDFESRVYAPMVNGDYGGDKFIPDWNITSKSPVLGNTQGMAQRYAENAMEQASGMSLPRPPYSKQLQGAIRRYERPMNSQYWDLEKDFYGQGFRDDIDKYLYAWRDEDEVNPEIPGPHWGMVGDPNRMLRRQQNFY